jgi:hypothetical protein
MSAPDLVVKISDPGPELNLQRFGTFVQIPILTEVRNGVFLSFKYLENFMQIQK